MVWWEVLLLLAGGMTAGIINTVAGGGSTLTVPLLVLAGVPGNAANGSNRVGILTSSIAAVMSFRRQGISAVNEARPVLVPVVAGSLVGSLAITRLTDDTFETVFGLLMIPIILLTLFRKKPEETVEAWPAWVTVLVFFGIGIYGGAIQAGVGLVMLTALSRAGYDLVTANAIKVLVNLAVTCFALPVFIAQGDIRWLPAIFLAAGLTAGGWLGARVAVKGGEKLIRAVMVVAALVLAGKLLGFYG